MKFKEKMRSSELVHPQASDPATLMLTTEAETERKVSSHTVMESEDCLAQLPVIFLSNPEDFA